MHKCVKEFGLGKNVAQLELDLIKVTSKRKLQRIQIECRNLNYPLQILVPSSDQ